ncbi:hypothetical protein WEI85_47320 [Actinomycetes bacterium KLBMP 9797]
MPEFLPPEAARFEIRGGVPVITLAVDPPAAAADGEWSMLSRMTMLIVDGPGEAGFLLPRLGPDGDVTPPGWDDAVDRLSGSHVVFGTGTGAQTVFARSMA